MSETTAIDYAAPLAKGAIKRSDFDVRAAIKGIREVNAGQDKVRGHVMWNAALLLTAARDADMIGADKTYSGQTDYAAALGYKPSTGTLLSRLAAVQTLGLKVTSPLWQFVVQNGTAKPVGDAIKAAESLGDLTTALKAIQSAKEETGKIPATPKGAQDTASEKEAPNAPDKGTVTPTVSDVLHTLHSLRAPVNGFDADQWAKVEDAMNKFIADQIHRRTKVAKQAPKAKAPKATPADVAKVVTKQVDAA